jgi:hypothetical protein
MKNNNFGHWAIDYAVYEKIKELIPVGSTVLEFGSGTGTSELAKHYTMYSVESNSEWVGKFESNYIYAPIKYYDDVYTKPDIVDGGAKYEKGWYDISEIQKNLPDKYDLILVDGPEGKKHGRGGFFKHIEAFKCNSVPIIFDDVNRVPELLVAKSVALALNKPLTFFNNGISCYIL